MRCESVYRKDVSVEMKLAMLCGNMAQVRGLLGNTVTFDNIGVAINNPEAFQCFEDRNLAGVHKNRYMMETGDDAVSRGRGNDAEVLAALSSMSQSGSRDFLAEQEVREFNDAEAKAGLKEQS